MLGSFSARGVGTSGTPWPITEAAWRLKCAHLAAHLLLDSAPRLKFLASPAMQRERTSRTDAPCRLQRSDVNGKGCA